jgi:SAM-dependent methyltransferase
VLEHLRDYPLKTLEETRRILRPGGLLLLSTPNAASLQNRFRLLRGQSVHTPLTDWMFGLPQARHAREYTLDELRQLLQKAGFETVRISGGHFHVRSGRTGALSVLAKRGLDRLGRLRPSLGAALVVLAQRPRD